MADEDRPLVSLVIASRVGGDALVACVGSFVGAGDDRLEIIVCECGQPDTPRLIAARFPLVHVRHFDDRRSIPDLRAAGIEDARGDIIALTTGRCRADPQWLRALRRAHADRAAAIGGAIEYGGRGGRVDRAVFLCEYGRYERPFAAEPSTDLPGQNVSYKRAAVDAFADLLSPATWEPLWHWRLHARGLTLLRDPAVVVWLTRPFTFWGFVIERYHYSRAFAGQRAAGRARFERILFAAGTSMLPFVLLARFGRQMLTAPEDRRAEWLRAMPIIALFTIPWAIGECVGYLAGPGSSAGRID